jgi:hypothetical protein
MTYYCFLCNDNHNDVPTQEHFIPRSIDGPEYQWLPVCAYSNTRSNSMFDNDARDMLYWVRYQNTKALKRSGEALLANGSIKLFKFSYHEDSDPEMSTGFRYIYDIETNTHIPCENVCAIAFPVGLNSYEKEKYHRGIAKISIGALAYLLKNQGVDDLTIRQLFTQPSIDAFRHFALDLPWHGKKEVAMHFSTGRSDVLEQLQSSCKNKQCRNHVINISQEKYLLHVEGMLYSQYGWVLNFRNHIPIEKRKLFLENPIIRMKVPATLSDKSQSLDTIVIMNPDFKGSLPDIPNHWRNK